MRIKRLLVEKLFNLFDHEILMNLDHRITIVHAPNGFGKTAILMMIDGVFNTRYAQLRAFPFQKLSVEFDDGRTLAITKEDSNGGGKKQRSDRIQRKRNIVFRSNGHEEFKHKPSLDRGALHFPLDIIDHEIPELSRIGPETWRSTTGEVLELEDIVERYQDIFPIRVSERGEEPGWLRDLKHGIDVRFIRTDRLVIPSQPGTRPRRQGRSVLTPTVMTYSEELASEIKSTLAKYAEVSQSLDRTFPGRLVSQPAYDTLSKSSLTEKLKGFEDKRSRLAAAGLLDQEQDPHFVVPEAIDETKSSVLSVYVRDVEQKLGVFDAIAAKIDLFKSLINKRFRHKQMSISREHGLVFTTDAGLPLQATSLSSGEQHEVILLYELLFKVRRDSLVLIDEPEISLHVAWQEQFLRDLIEMTRLSEFQVLLATHSPQIISDHWDLTVELHDAGT
ncbi:MAG: AAA family ATPase [bacterium]